MDLALESGEFFLKKEQKQLQVIFERSLLDKDLASGLFEELASTSDASEQELYLEVWQAEIESILQAGVNGVKTCCSEMGMDGTDVAAMIAYVEAYFASKAADATADSCSSDGEEKEKTKWYRSRSSQWKSIGTIVSHRAIGPWWSTNRCHNASNQRTPILCCS